MTDLQSNARVLQVEGFVSRYLAALISLPPLFRTAAFFGGYIGAMAAGWFLRGIL